MPTVYDYATDRKLDGSPSGALIEASEGGARSNGVFARMIDGIWTLVEAADVSTLRARYPEVRIVAVYVAQ